MGSHDFTAISFGKTADKAYKAAVEDAVYDYGHDPYNGTISTTNGFVMMHLKQGECVDDWLERVLFQDADSRIQKGESCACTPHPTDKNKWIFAGWAAC